MYYMGIDMGSTACKLVIVDDNGEIVKSTVSQIQGEPISTMREICNKILEDNIPIRAIGVTGSARNLIAKCLKTDFTKSEIIAHAYAAINKKNDVKTIIEIGGQDSKFICIENDAVSEFKMNSVCAAGTGSFLQWQAERLGLSIEEFDRLAMKADKQLEINGRCTVFIESSVVSLQRRGESKANIAYSICLCLAKNYMSELCKSGSMKQPIVFQGGVAKLKGMRRAFESVLGCEVVVFEESQLQGAIGIALLVKDSCKDTCEDAKILGLDFTVENYTTESFSCDGCNRNCILVRYKSMDSADEFIVGGRCGRY